MIEKDNAIFFWYEKFEIKEKGSEYMSIENQDSTNKDNLNPDNDNDDYIIDDIEDGKRKKVMRIVAFITIICLVFLIATPIVANLNLPALHFLKESFKLTQKTEVKEFQKSITTITVENRKGTGFNIDEKGLIVTNAHVVKNAEDVLVSFYKGKAFKGKVWKLYPHIDLALIKIEGKALPRLELAYHSDINSVEEVLIIGNPLSFEGVANKGVFYGMTDVKGMDKPIILIDGTVNKGHSGSPVINNEGEVIGVIFGTISMDKLEGKNLGAVIPIEYLLKEIAME